MQPHLWNSSLTQEHKGMQMNRHCKTVVLVSHIQMGSMKFYAEDCGTSHFPLGAFLAWRFKIWDNPKRALDFKCTEKTCVRTTKRILAAHQIEPVSNGGMWYRPWEIKKKDKLEFQFYKTGLDTRWHIMTLTSLELPRKQGRENSMWERMVPLRFASVLRAATAWLMWIRESLRQALKTHEFHG